MRKTIILLILGAFSAPSFGICQLNDSSSNKMNRVSVQTGLFHYFFDKAPILNINHLDSESSMRHPFKGLFLNSFGIEYKRKINQKSSLSIAFISFRNTYQKHRDEFPDGYNPTPSKALVFYRRFSTININYSRIVNITNSIDFNYGLGINYRHGDETIIVNKGWFDLLLEGTRKNDFGLNTFIGIDYNPIKWLTIFTKLNFIGFVYLHDKEGIKELKSYSNVPDYYPSRFDISLKFGIGVNF